MQILKSCLYVLYDAAEGEVACLLAYPSWEWVGLCFGFPLMVGNSTNESCFLQVRCCRTVKHHALSTGEGEQ